MTRHLVTPIRILGFGILLSSFAGCPERPRQEPVPTENVAPERATPEPAETPAEEIATGAEKIGDGLSQVLVEIGEDLRRAGHWAEAETREERQAFVSETKETVARARAWLENEAEPAAQQGARELRAEARDLAGDIERKLDGVGDQTGAAAERSRAEILRDLEKLQDKLRRLDTAETEP